MKRLGTTLSFTLLILVLAACGGGKTEKKPPALTPTAAPLPVGASNRSWTPVVQTFDGVDMVLVPAGCFMMGSTDAQISAAFQQCESTLGTGVCDRSWFERASPAHEVCFDKPFWIDRTEVTNGQYAAFNGQAASASQWAGDQLPREEITWTEADAFCEKRGARLPTEAEWEYVARGPEGWIYPWGNDFVADNVVIVYSGNTTQPADVGSKPGGASWAGALDLSGNVVEWAADWYAPYTAERQTNPTGPSSGDRHVLRGNLTPDVSAAYRFFGTKPDQKSSLIGFRCARSYEEAAPPAALIPSASAPLAGAPSPIPAGSRNADWTPVVQTFDRVDMVRVPAGCFMMGSTDAQVSAAFQQCESALGTGKCKRSWFEQEGPAHDVCFDKPFWIDRVEVTNTQFAAFGGQAASPSYQTGDNRPREQITWAEAQAFCEKRGARLPTEAEWEYAARGPEGKIYPWGNDFVADNVVYADNSGGQTADAGSKPGGASWVGALDLSGNVWEWMADWYGPYPSDPQTNPTGTASGDARVLRGGSLYNNTYNMRAAGRGSLSPNEWSDGLGFRCVRSG